MNKTTPAWLAAAALALAALALLLYTQWATPANPSGDARSVRRSLEAAAAFLSATELRGDDAWITTQGASKLGDEFRIWAETLHLNPAVAADLRHDPLVGSSMGSGTEGHLWALRWLESESLPRLPVPDLPTPSPTSTAMTEDDILSILRIMSQAVACHRLGDADRVAWVNELRHEASGYLLTHQLIALLLGLHQGCLDMDTAAPLRASLATRLWTEHHRDRSGIHDLSIERLAILCYAQVCDWLADEWINELIDRQKPSGSWGDNLNPNVHPRVVAREEHSAALAFYVLASVWQERHADASPPRLPHFR